MAEQESLLQGFKNFILRGNVVDLAVAVVIGMAFSMIIKAVVSDLIDPLIAAIIGKNDLSNHGIVTLHHAKFLFGDIISNAINFLAVAAVVYFLIVRPVNVLLQRFARGEEPVSTPDPQLELLKEIRDLLAAEQQV